MGETLIKVNGLSKKFCRSLKKSMWYGMRDIGSELLGRRHGTDGVLREDEFWAVKDISFVLNRGDCLGLIGHNGAGKTTLLRMLNGLIKPDQGRIEMRGKVGALIALGAGFNPVLTGRENVYVNAAVLGIGKKYVDSKIDEIIDFAEIREFINSPVQTYSSGMNVRLGFAVAAILIEPDILFLDEVLAVGDIGFAIKCLNTVRRIANKSAVVFVSHNMQQISWFSTRVMVLDHGLVVADSPNPSEGIDRYYGLVKHEQQTSGTGDAEIYSVELLVNKQCAESKEPTIPHGAELGFRIKLHINSNRSVAIMHIYIMDEAMNPVVCLPVNNTEGKLNLFPSGVLEVKISMGTVELSSGKYSITIAVMDSETNEALSRVQGLSPFRIISDRVQWGKLVRHIVPQHIDVRTPSL
ncbi:MAG: ATP-binding cassette domain-containing protein [Nitrospirae bacterium]|nr:ATP-binding cassette domain-containing protein [Nitrospirota bacterium]